MSKLRALVEEVDAALEIHIAGRSITRFNRVAYILADDCAELASKLFLVKQNANWQDKTNQGFKDFPTVTAEVGLTVAGALPLIVRMLDRRTHRNGFFHSTKLLDLTLPNHSVDDALIDVVDYCALLFGQAWEDEVLATQFMPVAVALVRLDRKARSDAHLAAKINDVFAKLPRYGPNYARTKGCAVVIHPGDQHLSLAIRYGGPDLRDKLTALLT